jgi:Asp-tRNA(Asn)/Glu-tRNA(Gln) amidotransferase A subunit family amidase
VVAVARAERDRYRERIAALEVDLLVTPTVPMVAPPVGLGDLVLRERLIELTFPWNVTGSPALALPCGPAEDGLPASVQLIGRPGDDALVLAAGRALGAQVPAADPASR